MPGKCWLYSVGGLQGCNIPNLSPIWTSRRRLSRPLHFPSPRRELSSPLCSSPLPGSCFVHASLPGDAHSPSLALGGNAAPLMPLLPPSSRRRGLGGGRTGSQGPSPFLHPQRLEKKETHIHLSLVRRPEVPLHNPAPSSCVSLGVNGNRSSIVLTPARPCLDGKPACSV